MEPQSGFVNAIGKGASEVTFQTAQVCDLVVEADGAWSKVRPLLTETTAAYTGTCFVETYLSADGNTQFKASAEVIGTGTLMAVAPGKGILAHRNADGSLHMYVALNRSEEWINSIDFQDSQIGLSHIAEQFRGWAPTLIALINRSQRKPILGPIYAFPVGLKWDRVPGVTLVGDAAHLMSPFAGEGANLPMYDGSELARALLAHPDDIETALATYEKDLSPRSEKFAGRVRTICSSSSVRRPRRAWWICSPGTLPTEISL